MGDMKTDKRKLRQEIEQACPSLIFKIKTVSFSDLARGEKVFVMSDSWGMTKPESAGLFKKVKAIAEKHGAIASW